MELIKETVQRIIQDLKKEKTLSKQGDIAQILQKILAKQEREHVRFIYCRKGVLGLAVDSSAWLYQMNLHKEKLLDKIKKKVNNIKEIRLHLG